MQPSKLGRWCSAAPKTFCLSYGIALGGLPWQYIINCLIFSPPDIHVGGLISHRDYSFFFRRLISEVAERNSTKIGHMLGSNCDLKSMSKIWGIPSPQQIRGPKITFLGRFRNLTATLTAYIFGKKCRQSVKCFDNYKESPTSSQNVMNFGP